MDHGWTLTIIHLPDGLHTLTLHETPPGRRVMTYTHLRWSQVVAQVVGMLCKDPWTNYLPEVEEMHRGAGSRT